MTEGDRAATTRPNNIERFPFQHGLSKKLAAMRDILVFLPSPDKQTGD